MQSHCDAEFPREIHNQSLGGNLTLNVHPKEEECSYTGRRSQRYIMGTNGL